MTCAYYLTKLGFSVVVLEKDFVGSKTTGHTTAKITSQHGLFYDYLISNYDKSFAKSYLDANESSIEEIKKIIDENKIKCDFSYQNSYVYARNTLELSAVKKEISALESLGFPCEFVTKTGLPFDILGAICFKNQAQFHPLKYLEGLKKAIIKKGGKIFENTKAINIEKQIDENNNIYYVTKTDKALVKSKFVIFANHYPFINIPGFYFTKMYQSTSYLIAIETNKTLGNGMYLSASQPIFSFRTANYNGKKLLLVGGGEHKTGEPPSYEFTYGALEKEAKKYYPDCKVLFRWNTRDAIPLDKIPYIGTYSSMLPNVFVGTGFKKWGMTSSNIAARIVVDKILGKENTYSYVFDSTRIKPLKNFNEMKNMVTDSVNSLILDKFRSANMDFEKIQKNSGSIIEVNGEKVGIYKDIDGKIYAVKPICTHLGCTLSWNDVDKTWDCPCHGSRFNYDGKNLYDPAFKDLDSFGVFNN